MATFPFRLGESARASAQSERLVARAAQRNRAEEVVKKLAHIARSLKTDPISFGEPKYNTRLPGGTVCQAVHERILVNYAVYSKEHVVLVLDFVDLDELLTTES